MNLIVDAGNTQIKWAIFCDGEIREQGVSVSWEELLKASWVSSMADLKACMLSSTRKIGAQVKSFMHNSDVTFHILDHKMKLPIKLGYETPETLGLDRIAGVAGARARFPDTNVLVIDLGTAITYDLLLENGCFLGGNISPGLEIRFKGLDRFTDNLPLVEFDYQDPRLGASTREAIQLGVQLGIQYEIEGYINTLINKYNGLRVILTGGAAEYFVKKLKKTIFVIPNLVLEGLNYILEHQLDSETGR